MTFELHLPVDSQNSLPVEALNLIVKSKSLPVEESNSTIEFHLPDDSQYSSPVVALSPGQTIATCQRNISQHCWAQHVAFGHHVAMCSNMLGVVGSSLKMVKFGPTTTNTSQHVATRWPNTLLRPTVLRYVELACCDRLAGALHLIVAS